MSKKPKLLPLLRGGNPWMVGDHVNRVVPVHTIQSFLSTRYRSADSIQRVRDLARGEPSLIDWECFSGWNPTPEEKQLLQRSMFALLAPDRRLFRTHNGNGPAQGSLTPLVAGLCAPTPSDDGLGKRMGELLARVRKPEWQRRLSTLMAPETPGDPATAFALALLGGRPDFQEVANLAPTVGSPPTLLETQVAEFVDTLIRGVTDARRLVAIQELGRGLYFGAAWLSVANALWAGGVPAGGRSDRRLVFVYAGMPPGRPNDPLAAAATRSFQRLVDASVDAMAGELQRRLRRTKVPSTARPKEEWEHRVRGMLAASASKADKKSAKQEDAIIELLRPIAPKSGCPSEEWCRAALVDRAGFDSSALARRLRSLGANVGFAGPDRGRGAPRLYCETPLLGTLVQGITAGNSMKMEDFVTQVRLRLGLVLGPGDDDGCSDLLGPIWGGSEGEELLLRNQNELRRRLVRAGLARTYSDAHTEVYARG